jgi:hypothetical protein
VHVVITTRKLGDASPLPPCTPRADATRLSDAAAGTHTQPSTAAVGSSLAERRRRGDAPAIFLHDVPPTSHRRTPSVKQRREREREREREEEVRVWWEKCLLIYLWFASNNSDSSRVDPMVDIHRAA